MNNTHRKEYLFLRLMSFLDNDSIEYVVVSDSSQYPAKIDSDIDIVIKNSHLKDIPEKMNNFCKENDISLIQNICHEQTARFFVFNWFDEHGNPCFMHPDICSDYFRNGKMFLSSEEMLSGRIFALDDENNSKGFYIPSPSKAFIYYLIKKIDKQQLNERQQNFLSMEFKKDPNGAIEQINRFWKGIDAVNLICALRENDWREIIISIASLKKGLHGNIKSSVKSKCLDYIRIAERIFHPTGLFVAFLGPDGAGKSTVIKRIKHDLAPAFRRTKQYHLRPQLIRNGHDGIVITEPHRQKNRHLFTSIIKLLYWLFDFSIGYMIEVRPRLIRSTLILFDRYYHDLLVDSKRYRNGAPIWIINFIGWFVPKPDLWILLDAPPEVLQKRKKEVSYEETEIQRAGYLKFMEKNSNHATIDTTKPLDQVITNLNQIILNLKKTHTENRLN
jgi:thymidylate kinase